MLVNEEIFNWITNFSAKNRNCKVDHIINRSPGDSAIGEPPMQWFDFWINQEKFQLVETDETYDECGSVKLYKVIKEEDYEVELELITNVIDKKQIKTFIINKNRSEKLKRLNCA